MKIRSGFVSNSSSSSFTCDCCGENQSGWDLSRKDAGMQECRNGHTFCEELALNPEISHDQMRRVLIASREKYRDAKWKKEGEVDAEIAEINALALDALEDEFEDYNNDDGCVPDYCPICQMQDVDDGDIVRYALVKLGFPNRKALAASLKTEFGTYDNLKKWIQEGLKTESNA